MGIEDRRKEVDELLRSGADDKLLLNRTDFAKEKIEKAYKIAKAEPKLPQPWRAIAAYRLGHLILRMAKTRDDLEDADRYLAEASREESLGLLPTIYRLPVLFRLKEYVPEETYISEYQKIFETAKRKVKEMGAGRLNPQASWLDTRLQGGYFNLLEFAAYFAGIPYSPLEGFGGDPYKDIFPESSAWILVGHDKTLAAVRYPKAFAIAELEARGSKNPNSVLFKLSNDDSVWSIADRAWVRTSPNGLLFLSFILSGKVSDMNELRRRVLGRSSFL